MQTKTVHILFEQSATFKNEFEKLNYKAIDYDIENQFNKTDVICDLFKEIENAFENKQSIFDNITENSLVLAFFPCTRFSRQFALNIKTSCRKNYNKSKIEILNQAIDYHNQINRNFSILCKLFIVCEIRKFKLCVENPAYSYLNVVFPFEPTFIHDDRTIYGDFFKKPTQYFFNFEPFCNCYFDIITARAPKKVLSQKGINRSLISSEYANFFIKTYLIEKQEI